MTDLTELLVFAMFLALWTFVGFPAVCRAVSGGRPFRLEDLSALRFWQLGRVRLLR
jgi:hypothetical protein